MHYERSLKRTALAPTIEDAPARFLKSLDRMACEQNHLEFTKTFFAVREGANFCVGPHHRVIARVLDDVFAGKVSRLLINIPPGYSKTQMCVIDVVARGLAINPKARFIHASYGEALVGANSLAVKDTIQSKTFQSMWDVSLRPDAKAKGLWKTSQGGGLLARPSGGPITGFRAGTMETGFTGALIIDDPLKPDDAERYKERKRVNRRWDTTFKSRLARENIPVIVIMQRLHLDDLSGFLLRGGSGETWDHIYLPVSIEKGIYPPEFTHGRPIDHRLHQGPLWSAKHNALDINKLRLESHTFTAQYMQRPIASGGSIFKSEWLQSYDTLPELEYRKIFVDTAQKTGQQHDFSVFQCWGKERGGNKVYLIDQIRGRWEEPDLINMARAFWAHNISSGPDVSMGRLRAMAIEDKVAGTSLIQHLRRDGIPVEAIPRARDKITRARDVTPAMNGGHVHLPKKQSWYPDFEAELLAFPAGAHDDQIDPMIDALTEMCGADKTIFDMYKDKPCQ